jgi:hypothetical protein
MRRLAWLGSLISLIVGAAGCGSSSPSVLVFYADPPVVFAGIDTQITVYASGLVEAPRKVALISPSGDELDLSDSMVFDEDRPGRVEVVVPSGLEPGAYDVVVDDGDGEAVLPGGLGVTDELALALRAIEPPFAGAGLVTGIELRAVEDGDLGAGQVQFARTPRAYLSPVAGGVARELGAVSFQSPRRLSGVIPGDLPAGDYDVIVVNPNGEVGLLSGGFTITAEPPPVVDLVSPGTLERADNQATTLFGSGFRDPEVQFTCRLSDGETFVVLEDEVVLGEVRTGANPQEIDIVVDAGPLDQGTVCVVRVTNSDETFFDFSAVNIANPAAAQNALAFSAGPSLNTPRRAPAAAGVRASSAARFIYAIGGDDGSAEGAFDTIEAASVGLFGDLGAWFELPIRLPAPRSFARAVTIADDHVYLVGGFDAQAGETTASALRAKVLDPADRPTISDVSLQLGDDGLAPGTWYYRLSAVVAEGSPQDPGGGEILASDPRVVRIPDIDLVDGLDDELQVILRWDEIPEAVEYRIYRTAQPDQASGDELLIASLDPTEPEFEPVFVDDGLAVDPAAIAPLPLGCTGVWHEVGPLATARQAHGLTAAREPGEVDDVETRDGTVHIYAVGGQDGAGDDLASVERLSVSIDGRGNQVVAGGWEAETGLDSDPGQTAAARRNLEALTANALTASSTGDRTFLYALGGTSGGAANAVVQAVEVLAGGALADTWQSGGTSSPRIPSMTPARQAYGAALANNHLYAVGGTELNTADGGVKAQICDQGVSTCPAGDQDAPSLDQWSNLSESLNMTSRAFMGKAVQSSFLYLVGGIDPNAGDAVLDSTAQTVLGGQP